MMTSTSLHFVGAVYNLEFHWFAIINMISFRCTIRFLQEEATGIGHRVLKENQNDDQHETALATAVWIIAMANPFDLDHSQAILEIAVVLRCQRFASLNLFPLSFRLKR